MEFNPVQTNQRPVREKIAQRLWELLRPVVFGCSPWFARKWRVAWLRFASAWYGGGMEHLQELLDRPYGACGLSMELFHRGSIFNRRTRLDLLPRQDHYRQELLYWRRCQATHGFAQCACANVRSCH